MLGHVAGVYAPFYDMVDQWLDGFCVSSKFLGYRILGLLLRLRRAVGFTFYVMVQWVYVGTDPLFTEVAVFDWSDSRHMPSSQSSPL